MDLYEVEECYNLGEDFPGNRLVFFRYPDGEAFSPFNAEKNVFIGQPVYLEKSIGLFRADFDRHLLEIWEYVPEEEHLEKRGEVSMGEITDCCGLRLGVFPLMLIRESGEDFEMLYPEYQYYREDDTETFLYRKDDELFFSSWEEDPEYGEYVSVKSIYTFEETDWYRGSLYRMPNGDFWQV